MHQFWIANYTHLFGQFQSERLKTELVGVTQLCIAFDGSNRGGVRYEGIVIAFRKGEETVLRFADMLPVDRQDAESIASSLSTFLDDVDFHGSRIVACDIAPTNLGVRTGVATRLAAKFDVIAIVGRDAHVCHLILNWFCTVSRGEAETVLVNQQTNNIPPLTQLLRMSGPRPRPRNLFDAAKKDVAEDVV